MKFNVNRINKQLTTNNIKDILFSLNSDIYKENDEQIIFYSACHNAEPCEHGHKAKLYYYKQSKSFTCYVCGESFDVYDLVKKNRALFGDKWSFPKCVKYVCEIANIPFEYNGEIKENPNKYNWQSSLLKFLNKGYVPDEKIYDKSILKFFNNGYHKSWLEDNISIETMEKYNIGYYPLQDCITIPCFNQNAELIGIRGRYLNPESQAKYYPIRLLDGTEYKFSTNDYLYGLWYTKQSIKYHKKCILFEAEKSTLQCDTYFGNDNFSVSLYGSAISKRKRDLILDQGINEVIIAIDFDYDSVVDENGNKTLDFEKFEKKVYKIAKLFKGFCKVTAIVSYGIHGYKDSPSDLGKDRYLELYKNREEVY